ncbi:hypothetical protein M422DRAFT_254863 [Sphaerobolus stellatus SS14]|uniref:Uncharacterized protein n=1 Tax=Sphaerobolus stellatus (strain SS14) TaxID=990650 RepID=A0A0C9VV48_SPHS4|nr:hypothetical protein M422DRAFT_254863 [Sphaerobolus stellatus SS14]
MTFEHHLRQHHRCLHPLARPTQQPSQPLELQQPEPILRSPSPIPRPGVGAHNASRSAPTAGHSPDTLTGVESNPSLITPLPASLCTLSTIPPTCLHPPRTSPTPSPSPHNTNSKCPFFGGILLDNNMFDEGVMHWKKLMSWQDGEAERSGIEDWRATVPPSGGMPASFQLSLVTSSYQSSGYYAGVVALFSPQYHKTVLHPYSSSTVAIQPAAMLTLSSVNKIVSDPITSTFTSIFTSIPSDTDSCIA